MLRGGDSTAASSAGFSKGSARCGREKLREKEITRMTCVLFSCGYSASASQHRDPTTRCADHFVAVVVQEVADLQADIVALTSGWRQSALEVDGSCLMEAGSSMQRAFVLALQG